MCFRSDFAFSSSGEFLRSSGYLAVAQSAYTTPIRVLRRSNAEDSVTGYDREAFEFVERSMAPGLFDGGN